MTEEIDLIKEVTARLTGAGIEYMMTGSMAMSVYSTPRMTRDIDMIIHVSPRDVSKLVDFFKKDFYIDETAVRRAIGSQGMFNIIHNESLIKVDFIVRKEEEYRILEFSRRQQIEIEGMSVSVVSPEDLILSKLFWARQSDSDLQLEDVRQMLLALPDIDDDYLAKWAEKIGVMELLKKVRKHA